MYSVGRQLIEIEHEVDLDKIGVQSSLGCHMDLPPEDRRVWDNMVTADADIQHDEDGSEIFWRKFSYILQSSNGDLDVKDKWISLSKI
jgi:YbbR domain-containing protein